MPRSPLILQGELPYGVTARSNNRDWFAIPMDQCWSIFKECIARTSELYNVNTYSFVLMSNHFHWLITTPNENLDCAMRHFMTETSRRMARRSGRINKIYGARYKWTLISNAGYYANTFRYFYQNPLRAGICRDVREYPWSTFQSSAASEIKLKRFPELEEHIPSAQGELLTWLNTIPDENYASCMKKALRRSRFAFPPHPTTKRQLSPTAFLCE